MAKVFFAYSHSDELVRNQLETHLSPLKRQGIVETWHDRRIRAGEHIDRTIDEKLETADIVLLLISADFLASDYCFEVEMARALEKEARGEVRVIPVIVRPCEWRDSPFGRLNAVPRDGKPISTFTNVDEACAEVARAVREAATTSARSKRSNPAAPLDADERSAHAAPHANRSVRLRRDFTDCDRDAFVDDAFEAIASYFERALRAIEAEHSDVETRFRKTGAEEFTVKVYVGGSLKAECAIWMERRLGSGIAFSWSAAPHGGLNEQLTVADDGYQLHLRALGMQTRGATPRAMTKELAAEYYWSLLVQRIES